MLSHKDYGKDNKVVHNFTGFAEVDKNPPVRRNTPQQRLPNSDQNSTKKQKQNLKSEGFAKLMVKTCLFDKTPCEYVCIACFFFSGWPSVCQLLAKDN